MATQFSEPSSSSNNNSGNNSSDTGNFECNICLELAQDPIVTLCGHLFCWPCLYQWLHGFANSSGCPVCKALIEEDKLVPLYGRGKTSGDPRAKAPPGVHIPSRPSGQRPATAPPPQEPNGFPGLNPWFVGGGAPVARFGNFTFSAAIGGLFPFMNFHVHGFPDAGGYGPVPGPAGFPYGYGHGHGQAWNGNNGFQRYAPQGNQQDNYLKTLLIVIGILVVATLLL